MKANSQASLRPAIEELERAFMVLAPLLFKQQNLPLPAITIQTAGRKNALGWFSHNRWARKGSNGKQESISEINICAEVLSDNPRNIAGTLIHEMVHYSNALDGVKDCSSNQYHNGRFKARAEQAGLIVEKMKGFGWASTSLSPELVRVVEDLKIRKSAFAMFRRGDGPRKKAETRMKKWACECTIVRCATELQAVCSECGEEFAIQD